MINKGINRIIIFLAAVKTRVTEIQQNLLKIDPLFGQYFENVTSLHVSVDYLNLTDKDIESVKKVIEEAAKKLRPFEIQFQGFETLFGFLYVEAISQHDTLARNHDTVQEILRAHNLTPGWWWPYVSHMTLADVNGPDQDRLENKWIFLLNDNSDMGTAEIKSIRLCAWDIPPGHDDYPVLAEAFFS